MSSAIHGETNAGIVFLRPSSVEPNIHAASTSRPPRSSANHPYPTTIDYRPLTCKHPQVFPPVYRTPTRCAARLGSPTSRLRAPYLCRRTLILNKHFRGFSSPSAWTTIKNEELGRRSSALYPCPPGGARHTGFQHAIQRDHHELHSHRLNIRELLQPLNEEVCGCEDTCC